MRKQTENTVFFRYSPSDVPNIDHRYFQSYFSDVGPVKKCSLIRSLKSQEDGNNFDRQRESKGYGFIKFTSSDDAVFAAKTYDGRTIDLEDGRQIMLRVELATDTALSHSAAVHAKAKRKDAKLRSVSEPYEGDTDKVGSDFLKCKKTSRIIVRNVSFYATEKHIKQIMEEKFGEVIDVTLPLVPSLDQKANDGLQQTIDNDNNKKRKEVHRGFAFVTFANPSSARKAVASSTGVDGKTSDPVIIKKRPVQISFCLSKYQHTHAKKVNHMDGVALTESDHQSKHLQDIKSENDQVLSSSSDDESTSSSSKTDDTETDSENDVDITSHDHNEFSAHAQDDPKTNRTELSHVNTLFLRNLPFDTSRHDLFVLLKPFGHIHGIYLVRDKDTGLGKGTAFVQFSNEESCLRVLDASHTETSEHFVSSKNILTGEAHFPIDGSGLFLQGRRILIDRAVDKSTAKSLCSDRDEDGNLIGKKMGKDKRNLYLKIEGRVEEGTQDRSHENAWENLPATDQDKRGRAHQEKSVKLRSPLFFINPFRLSIRNLAKTVDEAALKQLIVMGIERGLENHLVTQADLIAHWRASGEMTTRDIMKTIADADTITDVTNNKSDKLIPPFDQKSGIKKYIPSIYIDRDFQSSKGVKNLAPSRGFGFVEFTYHAHALACLRELNNNPVYSADFVAGGKRAFELKCQASRKIKSKACMKSNVSNVDKTDSQIFLGNDGKIRIPRLIVEFTVENKVMVKKQAEKRALQAQNKTRRTNGSENCEKLNTEKKRRGARQREKKRNHVDETNEKSTGSTTERKIKRQKSIDFEVADKASLVPLKAVKKRKEDPDETAFEDMVRSYKAAFSGGVNASDRNNEEGGIETKTKTKRWFA